MYKAQQKGGAALSKRYLLYGHGGAYNHGAEAITRCTIHLLRQLSPACQIALSTHFPEQDQEFGLLPDTFITRNVHGTTNDEVYRATLDAITSETIAIHVGGDNYCYQNWQRYALISDAVKARGGTSILWGCSVTPETLDADRLRALQAHDLILAREGLTFQALTAYGLKNVRKVCDIAFTLPAEPANFSAKRPYIVLNLSPLVCRENAAVLPAMQSLLRMILQTTDLDVVLLPHVTMPTDNDLEALRAMHSMSSHRVIQLPGNWRAAQYKDVIRQADFCIAARTHACIAAYSSCVPCLAIGYSTKAHGIAHDLDMSDYVVDCADSFFADKISSAFRDLLTSGSALRKKLEEQIPAYQSLAVTQEMMPYL